MTNAMSAPETMGSVRVNRVELSLAADAQMLFLARMTAAAVASRADFELERVEDLRLAIDELCIRLMNAATGAARITLVFQWDASALEVLGTLVPVGGPSNNGQRVPMASAATSDELSERILDALVDGHGGDEVDGVHRAWVRMECVEHLA
jgi:serine/threonine-protein kinase RsbW